MKDVYEVHITVATNEVEKFINTCKKIGVKPILIDLQTKTGNSVQHDLMTSSVYNGDDVYEYVRRLESVISEYGFNVVRKKIEVPPQNKLVPHYGYNIDTNRYFESHLKVCLNETEIEELRKIVSDNKAHLSRNIFKWSDGEIKMMVTIREYNTFYENFKKTVDNLKENITKKFNIEKVEVEYVIFDSNQSIDDKWIKS